MQKILSDLRQEIDQIDNQLISLLEARMTIVSQVSQLKKSNKEKFFIKQAREADMIKNLISKPNLKFPKSTIISIWRKLITAANMHEQPLTIALHNPRNIVDYNYLIREFYNNEVPIIKCDSAQNAILELEKGIANIGIFALPKRDNSHSDEDWWVNIAHNKHNLRVFTTIPFVKNSDESYQLVAVADIEPEKSMEDNSLFFIELESGVSRARLINLLKENNLNFQILKSTKLPQVEGIEFYLIEVDGFFTQDSPLIKQLSSSAVKPYIKVIGQYAKPIMI